MATQIRHLDIDCRDTYAQAKFWSAVLGAPMNDDDKPGNDECAIELPDGNQPRVILFIKVPEGKTVKNRLHLDIAPTDRTLLEEVERVSGLGAKQIDDRRGPRGIGWIVMTDPEGNEFCIESSAAEIERVKAQKAAEEAAATAQ
jgi:predicted enzyme related to lactoylglutathione lyase